jgi:hypothetical protein
MTTWPGASPRLPDFLELRTTYDPTGKFSNAFIDWRPGTRKVLLSRLNAAGSFLKGGDRPVGLSQNRPGDFRGVKVQDPAWSVHGFVEARSCPRSRVVSGGGCITSALTDWSAVEVVGAILGTVSSRTRRSLGALATG